MSVHRRGISLVLPLIVFTLAACGGTAASSSHSPVVKALAASTPRTAPAPTTAPRPSPAATPTPTPTPVPTPKPTAVPTPSPDALPGHTVTTTIDGHTVIMYVPGAYAALPTTSFPVLYFLHGSPGAASNWLTHTDMPGLLNSLIASGQLPPVLAVFPDDPGVVPDDSYWGNTAIGDSTETWFIQDLIPNIDATYRTLGARFRGIAGLSSGGFGAVNLAIQNPGVFSWVGSYSGVFTAPQNLFGSLSAQNSPQLTVSTVPAAQRFPLYLGQGAQDTEFGAQTTQFVATVEGLDWEGSAPLKTEVVPGGHTWPTWTVEAHDSLVWLGQLWRGA